MFYQLRSVFSFPLRIYTSIIEQMLLSTNELKGLLVTVITFAGSLFKVFNNWLIEIQSDSTHPGLDRLDMLLMSDEHNLLDSQSSISYDCPSEVKWKGALVVV